MLIIPLFLFGNQKLQDPHQATQNKSTDDLGKMPISLK